MTAQKIWDQAAIEKLLTGWCKRLAERLGDRLHAEAGAEPDVSREIFVHLHEAVDVADLLSHDANLFSALAADVEGFAAYGAVSFNASASIPSLASACADAWSAGVGLRLEFVRMYKRPGRVSVFYRLAVHPDIEHRAAWAAYLAAREEARTAVTRGHQLHLMKTGR